MLLLLGQLQTAFVSPPHQQNSSTGDNPNKRRAPEGHTNGKAWHVNGAGHRTADLQGNAATAPAQPDQ